MYTYMGRESLNLTGVLTGSQSTDIQALIPVMASAAVFFLESCVGVAVDSPTTE
jgi:hypothetical protein